MTTSGFSSLTLATCTLTSVTRVSIVSVPTSSTLYFFSMSTTPCAPSLP